MEENKKLKRPKTTVSLETIEGNGDGLYLIIVLIIFISLFFIKS
jgi:hypothetical protein